MSDLSLDEQKRLLKAERAAWFVSRLKELKRSEEEAREFELNWTLRRDDLEDAFQRWCKQRAAEYAELRRFRAEDDAQAITKIDEQLTQLDRKLTLELKGGWCASQHLDWLVCVVHLVVCVCVVCCVACAEIEEEYKRLMKIKMAEAELKHFQERKKLDAALQPVSAVSRAL